MAQEKPSTKMLGIMICKHCGRREYYGMMHFYEGTQMCRRCMYEVWRAKNKNWEPGKDNYVFPKYEDGHDYTKHVVDPEALRLSKLKAEGYNTDEAPKEAVALVDIDLLGRPINRVNTYLCNYCILQRVRKRQEAKGFIFEWRCHPDQSVDMYTYSPNEIFNPDKHWCGRLLDTRGRCTCAEELKKMENNNS